MNNHNTITSKNNPLGYLIIDNDRKIIDANYEYCKMSGFSYEELLNIDLINVTEAPDEVKKEINKIIKNGNNKFRTRNLRKNGKKFDIEITGVYLKQQMEKIFLSINKIPEFIETDSITNQETDLQSLIPLSFLDNTFIMLVYLDIEFNFIWVNKAYAETCKNPQSFFPGKNHFDLYPDDENKKIFQNVLETGNPFLIKGKPFSFIDQPQRGITFWDWSLYPIKNSCDKIIGLMFSLVDVTESKNVEAALIKSEEKFKMLADYTPDWEYWIDNNGNFCYVSPSVENITGYRPEDFIKNPGLFEQIIISEGIKTKGKFSAKDLFADYKLSYDFKVRHKDGKIVCINARCIPLHDKMGNTIGLRASNRDVTEQKKMEEIVFLSNKILQISNEKENLTDLLNEFIKIIQLNTHCEAIGIRLLDDNGNIPYMSYVGFSPDFYSKESPLSIIDDECMCIYVIKGKLDNTLPFVSKKGSFYMNGTTKFLAAVSEEEKGKTRNVCNMTGYESVALIPIKRADKIIGLVHLADHRENMVPISMVEKIEHIVEYIGSSIQRTIAEDNIEQSLKEKEVLLREIHHRVKNNLAAILGIINLQKKSSENKVFVDNFSALASRIQSMALVHEQLYKEKNLSKINFKEYINKLISNIRALFDNKNNITCTVNSDEIFVSIDDAIPCGMIINELVINSFKYAFPENYLLKGEKSFLINVTAKKDYSGLLKLIISDNGIGIPKEKCIEKIDTLGLQLVKMLGEYQLSGQLLLERSKGTEFTFIFKPKR